jgi:WhiB family transcriptional regulator, redox-sensing transcriptional regulator
MEILMGIMPGQRPADPIDPPRPACSGMSVDTFFRRDDERAESWAARERLALQLCATCPIRQACLAESLKFPASEQHGIAGGETAERRRELIANRRRRENRRSSRQGAAA